MHRKERRKYIRLPVTLEVGYKLSADKEGGFMRSLGTNISQEGIKFLAKEAIPEGSLMDLQVKAPGYAEVCQLSVKVIWCHKSGKQPGYYATGAKFMDADISKLAMLVALCGGMLYQRYTDEGN